MLKNKKILFSLPLMIMGFTMILLGSRWMIVDEPWLLDKVANEARLEMSFNLLFKAEINQTLPGYLQQIYIFFGLWVSIIGLFILLFSNPNMIKIKDVRIILLISIGIMVSSGLILGYVLIPKSPFILLGWMLLLLYSLSLYIHLKYLNK